MTTGTSIPQPGNLVTITGAQQSAYNVTNAVVTGVTYGANGGINGVTFTLGTTGLTADGGQGINDVNWISHCTLQDYFNTSTVRPVHDIEVVATLYFESIIQPPFKACLLLENLVTTSLTTLTMRLWPVPSSQIWNVFFNYQKKAPIKTSLQNTWAPWPDNLGYVLRTGLLSRAYQWFEDPRYTTAEAMFQQNVLKALDSKDQEQRSEGYFPDLPLMRGG